MKKVKKFLVFLLALTFVFAIGSQNVSAAELGKITVKNTVEGQTYTIYKVLELESYNTESNAYAYKASSEWAAFVADAVVKGVYLNTDDQGYVTWVEGADAAAFAKLALAHAKENSIQASASEAAAADNEDVIFDNLPLGYYLLDSSLGALCGLTTTKPEAVINEKNAKPTITKEVKEDSTEAWGASNDADMTQLVEFKTTVTAASGAENYVVHDKMSAGLTFGQVTAVKLNEAVVAQEGNYTVVTEGLNDGCTFEVRFTKDFCDRLNAQSSIVIEYNATLNHNAVIAGEGNPNDTKLTYGDNNSTEWVQTVTYTWKIDAFKYTQSENEKTPLAGAKFALSKEDSENPTYIKFSEVEGQAKTYKTDVNGTVTEFVTAEDGKLYFQGLDADTYYLYELEAPAGYNKLVGGKVKVVVGENGAVTVGDGTEAVSTVEIENKSGSELPSTGGIGTDVFYIGGGLLMASALVFMTLKKKKASSEE